MNAVYYRTISAKAESSMTMREVRGPRKRVGSTARHEYTMKDHLGNTRLVYSDTNNDGIITVNTEILQETHYYPLGEQGCSSHMKWLVAEVKRSFRPAEDRGAISVVWNGSVKVYI